MHALAVIKAKVSHSDALETNCKNKDSNAQYKGWQ